MSIEGTDFNVEKRRLLVDGMNGWTDGPRASQRFTNAAHKTTRNCFKFVAHTQMCAVST